MTRTIGRVGYWSGLSAAAATLAYDVVQILQLARVLRFPFDEISIYGTSQLIVVPLLFAMLSLHYLTPPDRQFWTHAALLFTLVYAVFVTANYVVQLATVIPARLRGEAAAVGILEQTPHSLFWDYDAVGYLAMGLAALVAVPAFDKEAEKWARRAFIAHASVTPLIGIVYFYPVYSERLLFLGFPWAATAPLFMVALAITAQRRCRTV